MNELLFQIFSQYIVLVVLLICLAVGYVIKHSLPFIKNDYIPLIMAVLGVVLNLWVNNFVFTPEVLLGGIVSGLASTGAHELIRNIIKKE